VRQESGWKQKNNENRVMCGYLSVYREGFGLNFVGCPKFLGRETVALLMISYS
jgi:hypothetical protein